MGGLEGFALQEKIFLWLVFASEAGKNKPQKFYSRGPAAPAAPAGELASSIFFNAPNFAPMKKVFVKSSEFKVK